MSGEEIGACQDDRGASQRALTVIAMTLVQLRRGSSWPLSPDWQASLENTMPWTLAAARVVIGTVSAAQPAATVVSGEDRPATEPVYLPYEGEEIWHCAC